MRAGRMNQRIILTPVAAGDDWGKPGEADPVTVWAAVDSPKVADRVQAGGVLAECTAIATIRYRGTPSTSAVTWNSQVYAIVAVESDVKKSQERLHLRANK